ncbi:F-box/FBD/LRR-repeat protein At1g13570-like [Bidens hawaiensis]|uniref:F-box/FBD/LRR-repeat protein At1g13570-like n=1 Tax=Bidens hawaiensis TaxID=980011 RepID=UPI00404B6311
MPDIVINNIPDRLSLQDTVMTAILNRNWRYNWTMLNQLIFDDNFFKYLLEKGGEKNYEKIIGRLLLHIKGTITKFVLYIEDGDGVLDVEDINHWLLFLSSKGVKDITLWKENYGPPLKLPMHLFSCLELKHLKLVCCCFGTPASFHGFLNLVSLELSLLKLHKIKKFGEFFTGCPALEILNLGFNFPPGKVKPFTKDGGGKRSSNAFPSLKALKLTGIYLGNNIMLSCALELIRCSPNMQTLEITASKYLFLQDDDPTPAVSFPEVDYNTMGSLQIRSVVFNYSKGSVNEDYLFKYLLSSSPFLKKIDIRTLSSIVPSLFPRKLLKLQRAYPDVDINVY